MKVSIARIRLYLKSGKTLADGSHPIMLMCSFNGKKEVSTGYSCLEKYWDKSSQCVKKGYPNWVMINHEINKLKNEAIERRNEYERLGEVYTPHMVLCKKEVLSAVSNDLKGLISNYVSDKDYYCWDGKRYKTLKAVKVRIPCHTIYTEMMVKTMLMFNQGEWFLPVLNGLTMETAENNRKHRISNTRCILSPKLKEWFQKVNEEVVKRNVDNDSNIPLIDMECTYYSARHSFAMMYMLKGGSPMNLATLLGRSPNTLSQYIKELTEEGDLVDAVSII